MRWWKRSYWVQIWAGLHFRFIFVWIKGALHWLGSQGKHVAPGPCRQACLPWISPGLQARASASGASRTLAMASHGPPRHPPSPSTSIFFPTGSKPSSLRCIIRKYYISLSERPLTLKIFSFTVLFPTSLFNKEDQSL